jgi:hypothetical protein
LAATSDEMSAMTEPEAAAASVTDVSMTGDGGRRHLTLPPAAFQPPSPSPVAPLPLSPSLATIKTSAVFSAAKRLVQVKENLSDFQKKGGFVGWLHGDEDEQREPSDVEPSGEAAAGRGDAEGEHGGEEDAGDAFALAYSPTNPKREALDALVLVTSSLWPVGMKPSAAPEESLPPSSPVAEPISTDEVVEVAGRQEEVEDDGLHTPPSPRSASASPDKAAITLSTPVSTGTPSMVRRSASGSASMFESLYEKVVRASSSGSTSRTSSSPRISLQPSPRRKSARAADALASGFDDFVSAEGTARKSKVRPILLSCSLSLVSPFDWCFSSCESVLW